MHMSIHSATSAVTYAHAMPTTGPSSSMPAMHSMVGMSSTFSASTRVTLWFTDWTTTTTTTYVLTILFLFSLGIFNRFLGALKNQLERKWSIQSEAKSTSEHMSTSECTVDRHNQGHTRQWSRALRPQSLRRGERIREETEPLSPISQLHDAEEKGTEQQARPSRLFWTTNAPWSLKRDSVSAIFEFTRALIGYMLMLAVMTYNIGFLFAVTGSVLFGELVFGRYMRGSANLAQDGCHS